MSPSPIRRQDFLACAALGITGLAAPKTLGAGETQATVSTDRNFYDQITERVLKTPFIDTHEHLMNESERIQAGKSINGKANDWSFLFSHYFDDDMSVSGMTGEARERFFSPDTDPLQKWDLIAPYWPYLKQTGYGQNIRISVRQLYGIGEISKESIPALQEAYKAMIRPGFYRKILRDISNIECCHVNRWPFLHSEQPDLLKSDYHIDGLMQNGGNLDYAEETGIRVHSLDDWHRVIDSCLKTYGPKSVGLKCVMAYSRDIDFIPTPSSQVESVYLKKIAGHDLEPTEQKALEDHLFWYVVDQATGMGLPVKMHTGYYAGHGYMPLSRLKFNPGSASELCRNSPETKFVFFHIGYPHYEEFLALAKHYPNAWVDMCWSWIINPIAAKDFLKKFIVTVPSNKIWTFGGDYIPVELIPGHAAIARHGIALALAELADEGWVTRAEALELCDPLMNGNARAFFGGLPANEE